MIKLIAAGGVLYRRKSGGVEIFLIKRNGCWDIPKGKLESDESIPECAVREVAEELGISPPSIVQSLGTTEHTYTMDGTEIHKTTHWFLMQSDARTFQLQTMEGITDYSWTNLIKATQQVAFDNLKIVVERTRQALLS
jgi:8-oxo-dGTP pyrophosphatase MutT (NUDIX family)